MSEVSGRVRKHCSHTFVSFSVVDIHCEDHRLSSQPLGHGCIEVDLVSNVIRQLHNYVLHNVEYDHFDEVPLFKCLGKDDLVGHVPLLVTVVLYYLLLPGQLFIAALAVEYDYDYFVVLDLKVEVRNVFHLDDIRVEYL